MLLVHTASFLDHFAWIQRLALVSKHWRQQLMQQQHWRTEGMKVETQDAEPALLSTSTPGINASVSMLDDSTTGTHAVCQIVRELVLSDCPVSDDHVLQLVGHCSPSLKRLALQRCNQISFLLLYELTRRAKSASRSLLEHVDVSLCRGVSPAYVSQLRANGVFERTGMCVSGPGFAIAEVSSTTWHWIERASHALELATCAVNNQHEDASGAAVTFGRLVVRFVPKTTLLSLFAPGEQQLQRSEGARCAARELPRVRDAVDALALSSIPFVRLDSSVFGHPAPTAESLGSEYTLVGVPATLDDVLLLARQHEDAHTVTQLSTALASLPESHVLAPPAQSGASDATETLAASNDPRSLDARAEQVFAMLRETTRGLEAHVAHLEQQVQRMAAAKDAAQREYVSAQMELDRVAREADRALLSLATSSAVLPPPPPLYHALAMSSIDSNARCNDGDELLPPLPTDERLQALGVELETHAFAVLDGFLGDALSGQVRCDLEQMYAQSRVCEPDSHADAVPPASFALGELAGGNTGRNVRYKMAHVRGDYVLWLDERDACCPVSVQQTLRQLDRLVLERLPQWNCELRASALLRKKAMATCYPGNGARYTRHCDNPNKNGRKLTAILYLNRDWMPSHGGELLLHLPSTSRLGSSRQTTVAPLLDRVLLFFSDRRVPHEVLPCAERNRFALTVWYLDYDEFMSAQVFGEVLQDERNEAKRIEHEIAAFAAASSEAGGHLASTAGEV